MATYRRLVVGRQPVVLSLPEWLLHDDAVNLLYRTFCRASGGRCLSYTDASQVVLIVPRTALDEDADLLWVLHRLQDEITVWRLATADGARGAGAHYGRTVNARMTAMHRRRGSAPVTAGWRVA